MASHLSNFLCVQSCSIRHRVVLLQLPLLLQPFSLFLDRTCGLSQPLQVLLVRLSLPLQFLPVLGQTHLQPATLVLLLLQPLLVCLRLPPLLLPLPFPARLFLPMLALQPLEVGELLAVLLQVPLLLLLQEHVGAAVPAAGAVPLGGEERGPLELDVAVLLRNYGLRGKETEET